MTHTTILTGSAGALSRSRKLTISFVVVSFIGLSPMNVLARQETNELPSMGISEAPAIRVENMGLEDGLAQGSIYQITQDSQGYIWFGTQSGLHRYDGQEFKVYTPVPFDTTSMMSGWVWGVSESRDGSIWAATTSSLERLDPDTGVFEHWRHDPDNPSSISQGNIYTSLESRDGTIWVGTDTGLNKMDKDRTGVFEKYVNDPDNENSISNDSIYFIYEDDEGEIWISTDDGLNRLDPVTGNVSRYLNTGTGTGDWGDPNLMLQILPDPREPEIMWVGSGWGLIKLNLVTGDHERFLPYADDPEGSSRNSVLNTVSDPGEPEVFWLGLLGGGVARFDSRKREFTLYHNDPTDPTSIDSDLAGSVFTDNSGVVWVGYANKGIGKFNPASAKITHLGYDPEGPPGIMDEGVPWALFEDSQERFWISSSDLSLKSHLTRFDIKTGELDRYQHEPASSSGVPAGFFQAIIEDQEGNIWIGGRGVSRCEPESMECKRFDPVHADSTKLPNRPIHALYESPDEPGIIWVGSSGGGLNRLDSRTGLVTRYPYNLTDARSGPRGVAHIMEDAAGTMWLGTFDMGLVRFDRDTGEFTRFSYNPADRSTVSSKKYEVVHERASEPGILWLAGVHGLDRFDIKTETVRHFTTKDGMIDGVLYGLLEDEKGQLWMSTNRGISSFDPETETFRNYGLDDGLKELEGMQNSFAKGAGGMMYFGNVAGISAFVPGQLTTNLKAPPVSLTELRVNGKRIEPGPGNILSSALRNTDSITLEFGQNDFAVEFVALHFADPTSNTFSYHLEGYDENWSEPALLRTASYTNIGPGTYTFRVRAANPDGVWNEEGASLEVVVLPPWYRTGWALTLFAILLGGAIFGFDRVQRVRLTRKERERAAIQEAELRAQAAESDAKALKSENDRKKNIERLSEIGKEITASLDFETIFGRLYEHINDLTDAPIFGVGVYDSEKQEIEYRLAIENGKRYAPYSRDTKDKNQLPVWCIENREAVFINDIETDYSRYIESYNASSTILEDGTQSQPPQSLIYLPLTSQDRVLGVITVQSFKKNAYTEEDLNLLQTMAAYASVALDNSTAYRKLDGTISELKRTQQQLVQQEKMASLGQLTAGVAHEIKNPLNFVNNFADVNAELASELRELVSSGPDVQLADIRSELDDLVAGLQLNARQIAKHGRRADEIVKGMMQHTHRTSGERFPVAINAFVDEYINLAWHGKRATDGDFDIKVVREYAEDVGNANISPAEMGRVLVNLVNNAFDACRDEEKPEVSVSTRLAGKNIEIIVDDNGPGVPDEIREKIFEPFFTTKPTGEGTGLGLSLSHDIVTQGHGGAMKVEKSPTGGASFIVSLPMDNGA